MAALLVCLLAITMDKASAQLEMTATLPLKSTPSPKASPPTFPPPKKSAPPSPPPKKSPPPYLGSSETVQSKLQALCPVYGAANGMIVTGNTATYNGWLLSCCQKAGSCGASVKNADQCSAAIIAWLAVTPTGCGSFTIPANYPAGVYQGVSSTGFTYMSGSIQGWKRTNPNAMPPGSYMNSCSTCSVTSGYLNCKNCPAANNWGPAGTASYPIADSNGVITCQYVSNCSGCMTCCNAPWGGCCKAPSGCNPPPRVGCNQFNQACNGPTNEKCTC